MRVASPSSLQISVEVRSADNANAEVPAEKDQVLVPKESPMHNLEMDDLVLGETDATELAASPRAVQLSQPRLALTIIHSLTAALTWHRVIYLYTLRLELHVFH